MLTVSWPVAAAVLATWTLVILRGAVLCRAGLRVWRRNRAEWLESHRRAELTLDVVLGRPVARVTPVARLLVDADLAAQVRADLDARFSRLILEEPDVPPFPTLGLVRVLP